MMQAPFLHIPDVRDHPARLLLLSEVGVLPPHDGIRRIGRSHLSRAVESTPHEFPRSRPIPSSSRDASSSVEEVERVVWLPFRYAAVTVQRKSASSRHIRWSIMASLRATATIAFWMPRRRATAIPQALSGFQRPGPVSTTRAAS